MSKKLVIVGVGLIGGSIGLAVKAKASGRWSVSGYGLGLPSLRQAKHLGAIDDYETNLELAVKDADLIIVCTPISVVPETFRAIVKYVKRSCVVTDVGSTKGEISTVGQRIFRDQCHFVGSHPMAGSEKQGVAFANKDLFENRVAVLTPTSSTSTNAKLVVSNFWISLGMRVVTMTARDHDQRASLISHLPHVAATALANIQSADSLAIHGPGFSDTTRVAAGSPRLWRDILHSNKEHMVLSIDRLISELAEARRLIVDDDDADSLIDWLEQGKSVRDGLTLRKGRLRSPQYWTLAVDKAKIASGVAMDSQSASGQAIRKNGQSAAEYRRVISEKINEMIVKSLSENAKLEGVDVQLIQSTPDKLFVLARSSSGSNPQKTESFLKNAVATGFGVLKEDVASTFVRNADVISIEQLTEANSTPLRETWRSFISSSQEFQTERETVPVGPSFSQFLLRLLEKLKSR